MIIKIFNQGSSDGSRHIDYLLDEGSHAGYKPEVLDGYPELTKAILRSMSYRKNRYTAGVISFREGEQLSESQQRELMADFKRAFAPFDEESRSNFLFVRHYDKDRLELHWVTPRQDLKTGRSWSIYVPGKANALFYESFVRLQNYRYGFQQVDGKEMRVQDIAFYTKTFHELHGKRESYLLNRYNKATTKKHNKKRRNLNGLRKSNGHGHRPTHQEDVGIRNIIEHHKSSLDFVRANNGRSHQNPNNGTTSNYILANRNEESSNRNQCNVHSSKLTEWGKQFRRSPQQSPALSIDDEILALAIQLNSCEHHEAPALIARINYLQGVREHGIPKGKPKPQ